MGEKVTFFAFSEKSKPFSEEYENIKLPESKKTVYFGQLVLLMAFYFTWER